jgi:hypothetical protein
MLATRLLGVETHKGLELVPASNVYLPSAAHGISEDREGTVLVENSSDRDACGVEPFSIQHALV